MRLRTSREAAEHPGRIALSEATGCAKRRLQVRLRFREPLSHVMPEGRLLALIAEDDLNLPRTRSVSMDLQYLDT